MIFFHRILIALTLLLAAQTATAQAWVGGYYCAAEATEAELARRVVQSMGLPPAAVRNLHVFCVAHMDGPIGGRTYQEIGFWTGTPCTREYWTYLIGCINGAAQSVSPSGGWVVAFRASPVVMDKYIAIAKRDGMSRGSRTWDQIRCLWTLERLMRVWVHELHHVYFGYRHGAAMAAADRTAQDRIMTQHGAWIRMSDWPCSSNRVYVPRRPEYITEHLTP